MISGNRPKVFDKADRGKSLIFVYATLMNPKTRDYVLHHKESGRKAELAGYKRVLFTTPEGKDFNTLEKSTKDFIDGDVIEVTANDLEKLKQWEDQYHLIPIQLKDGRQAQAFKLNKLDEISKK